eukprot:g62709.t1
MSQDYPSHPKFNTISGFEIKGTPYEILSNGKQIGPEILLQQGIQGSRTPRPVVSREYFETYMSRRRRNSGPKAGHLSFPPAALDLNQSLCRNGITLVCRSPTSLNFSHTRICLLKLKMLILLAISLKCCF